MFVDSRQLAPDSIINVDVCIVGAGAAGITLARDLVGGKRSIALLESGGYEFDAASQELYVGSVIGHDFTPLDRDRLRFLGGTTNHWEGSCRPFDALDLEGWPIGPDVLAPYYRRAHEVCQLGPYQYAAADWASAAIQALEPTPESGVRSGVFQFSPPTRFGMVYRDDLAKGDGLTVYLYANVLDIETDENAAGVTGLKVGCLDGRRFTVRARQYVLATGGIENPRLMLNANRVQSAGLGNGFDQLGRYFMDHPYVVGGATVFGDPSSPQLRFYDKHEVRGTTIEGYFGPSDAVRRRERLPPFAISLWALEAKSEYPNEVELPKAIRDRLPENLSNQIAFGLTRSDSLVELPARWLYERVWRQPKGRFTTFYICGPAPDPQSRVTLSNSTDALGLRQVQLDWRLPYNFEAHMQRAHELLAQELGRSGLARVRIESSATGNDPMKTLSNGHHHMGTTRMHQDPHQGVVDADCRVHGLRNLFIGGSSVFPTYACDNPTMTIVALALRLSEHLKAGLA